VVHALWIEQRQQYLQTLAMLGLSGALKQKVEPDAHQEFDDLYGPPKPVRRAPRQDPEERMRIIAALANAG
jgi:hypothetical protein